MTQVVNVAKQFLLQLGVADRGDRDVLVNGPDVAEEAGGEVGDVGGDLLDHVPPAEEFDRNAFYHHKRERSSVRSFRRHSLTGMLQIVLFVSL